MTHHRVLCAKLRTPAGTNFTVDTQAPQFENVIAKGDFSGGMNLLVALGFREGYDGELCYDLPARHSPRSPSQV